MFVTLHNSEPSIPHSPSLTHASARPVIRRWVGCPVHACAPLRTRHARGGVAPTINTSAAISLCIIKSLHGTAVAQNPSRYRYLSASVAPAADAVTSSRGSSIFPSPIASFTLPSALNS